MDKEVEIIARSDASFDGRSFDGLSRSSRERYIERARASWKAVLDHRDQQGQDREK